MEKIDGWGRGGHSQYFKNDFSLSSFLNLCSLSHFFPSWKNARGSQISLLFGLIVKKISKIKENKSQKGKKWKVKKGERWTQIQRDGFSLGPTLQTFHKNSTFEVLLYVKPYSKRRKSNSSKLLRGQRELETAVPNQPCPRVVERESDEVNRNSDLIYSCENSYYSGFCLKQKSDLQTYIQSTFSLNSIGQGY